MCVFLLAGKWRVTEIKKDASEKKRLLCFTPAIRLWMWRSQSDCDSDGVGGCTTFIFE